MAKTVVLEYTIWLTDEAQVAALQAADGGNDDTYHLRQRVQAPLAAAVEFGAPISDPTNRLSAAVSPKQTGPFTPPAITSTWFTSDANYPLDEAEFSRKGAGWFGISWLFPSTTNYAWVRYFAYAPATGESGAGEGSGDGNPGTTIPPPPTVISNRRWVDGGELPGSGLGATVGANIITSRDASRHVDGLGWALRNLSAVALTHALAFLTGGGPYTSSWERFYVRLRKRPSANGALWDMGTTPSPAEGMRLHVGPAGELIVLSSNPAAALTLHGSAGVLPLDTWVRIDLLIDYVEDRFQVYLNGVRGFDITAPPGLNGTAHVESHFGSTAMNGMEIDVDDWINADLPTRTITPPDTIGVITDPSWFAGSRCTLIRPTAVQAPGTWTHPVEGWRAQLLQAPEATLPTVRQESAAALDTIVYETDAERSVDSLSGQKGAPAFVLALFNMASAAVNGRIGYQRAGAAAVLAAHDNPHAGAHGWSNGTGALYNGGVVTPPPLGGLRLIVEHSNSVQTESHAGFFAEAEVLGHWGEEDPRALGSTTAPTAPIVATVMNGIHNAPYPYTPWATSRVMAPAPVAIYGGTYVGTGAPTDLTFNLPIHWLWIRPVTGSNEGARWWSSMISAHKSYFDGPSNSAFPHILIDPNFAPAAAEDAQETQTMVRLLGHSQTNLVGVTYQYIAVSDAAMRFMLNGAFAHLNAAAVADNALWNTSWVAQAGFFWNEKVPSAGVAAQFWYKGIGHATAAASKLDSAESATAAEFLVGAIRSHPTLHNLAGANIPFSLWRREDGNNDPGAPRVVQLVSYVGDNAASRVISLTPLSGRRPLFCLVVPHNATPAIYRDPSHTGTTSSQINNVANAATGIIAGGLDTITVGLALNATGIFYDVFVLPGDTAACNAGWSCNGIFIPVEPNTATPPGGEEFPPENPDEGVPPTIDVDLGTDLSLLCAPFTHKAVNMALSKLGHTIQVTDLSTELTTEAVLARLHYTQDVARVLRDYPWAFATRYRALTLVRGPADGTGPVQTWVATQAYEVGDTVNRSGTMYYCLVAHTNQVPPNATYWTTTPTESAEWDWTYAYREPVDCIFSRRLVREGMARMFDPDPPAFRIGQDPTGNLIYSNERDAVLEFTYRPPCGAGAGDPLFREALEWRLAHSFAPGLSKDAKMQTKCWEMYRHTLTRATVPNANEQQPQKPHDGDPDWITGRN